MEFLAVADMYLTETANKADVVLPLVSLAESNGTVISMDGAVNSVKAAVKPMAETNINTILSVANAMKINFNYADEKEVMREIVETKALLNRVFNPVLKAVDNAPIYKDRVNTSIAYKNFLNTLEAEGLIK